MDGQDIYFVIMLCVMIPFYIVNAKAILSDGEPFEQYDQPTQRKKEVTE